MYRSTDNAHENIKKIFEPCTKKEVHLIVKPTFSLYVFVVKSKYGANIGALMELGLNETEFKNVSSSWCLNNNNNFKTGGS